MQKAVSVTSLGSLASMQSAISIKNRHPEYRRNVTGTVIFLQVILLTSFFVAKEVYGMTGKGEVEEVERMWFVLNVVRVGMNTLMLINLGIALVIRGYGLEQPFLKYITLPLAALSLLPLPMMTKQPLQIILTLLAVTELTLIYAGLLTQNRKTALGRNVQPWYERTPLIITNVEIGRSVSMLRASQNCNIKR